MLSAAPWNAHPVRVLFNLLDAGIGGGQQVAIGIAGELRRRGHAVGVVVPEPGPATERFAALGADVYVADLLSLRHPAGVLSAAGGVLMAALSAFTCALLSAK